MHTTKRIAAGAAGVAALTSLARAEVTAVEPGYVTVMWGRSNWEAVAGRGCTRDLPGTRTLLENAEDLRAHGLFGVGGVTVQRTQETDRTCIGGYATQTSWADLANLRDVFGWKFVSQGMEYKNMTLMTTDAERRFESVDTLPHFEAHGHSDAWGGFNYPANKSDAAAQSVVTSEFAFGRRYDARNFTTRASASTYPHEMRTMSITGGRCWNQSLSCYNMAMVGDRRTTPPANISRRLRPGADQWGVVQWYRIVEGSLGSVGETWAWDCEKVDWRDRWTSQPELTCRSNFLAALAGRSATAVVTHPAEVARAWGRVPGA